MSHQVPGRATTADPEPTAVLALPRPAPVLITENQVVFSTAAAAAGAATRRWPHTVLMAGVGRILAELTKPHPPQLRRESSYLEAARMSRAMDRL